MFVSDGVAWTTTDLGGRGVKRPVPTATGREAGRAWSLPFDERLGSKLAGLLDSRPATRRALAFAGLVAAASDLVRSGHVLPVPAAGGWRWRPAPDAEQYRTIAEARAEAVSAGVYWTADDPGQAATQLFGELTAGLAGPAPEPPAGGTTRWRRWAELVVARRAAARRLALRILPPEDAGGAWLVEAETVLTDAEGGPREELSLVAATDESTFEAAATWQQVEEAALARAWPGARVLPCELTGEQLIELVDGSVPRIIAAGIDVIAPEGLLRPARVNRRIGSAGTGHLSWEGVQLQAAVQVDGTPLTPDELAQVAAAASGLVRVRDRWIRLDPAERSRLARLLALMERGTLTAAEVMAEPAFEGCEWDPALFGTLAPARRVRRPAGLRATLRHYQRDGVDWLTWIEENGTGGILADDMGLGKTLQVLARIAADHAGPTLVVCPVTLVDTWLRQSAQFTPKLRIRAHHGTERASTDVAGGADVVVTTYGLLARDSALAEVDWHRVVLDEAQAIKNPDTRAARAARALPTRHRLAVTGTPVENHVGDLWSLLAFASPGLLPGRTRFQRRFAGSGTSSSDLDLLRTVTAPFVLRRVKSDPSVAPELPDRQVVRDDCVLTPEQVAAYEAAVQVLLTDQAETGGQRRRAAVLAALMRLKQICVHPGLPAGRTDRMRGRSGKVDRLVELGAEIVDEGQAVVVFTQFASFAAPLAAHLTAELGVPALTLTGSDSRQRRGRVVDEFSRADGPPVLVASIKAGGSGLTLVRANHVVHLDRWWNPAVEDQASDRVWRIGQGRKVLVHNLICPGTLEERIDEMLTHKRGVADAVVTATGAGVTELTADELATLVTLSRERMH